MRMTFKPLPHHLVEAVIAALNSGDRTQKDIADEFHISQGAVCRILATNRERIARSAPPPGPIPDTYDGMTISQMAKVAGVCASTIRHRLARGQSGKDLVAKSHEGPRQPRNWSPTATGKLSHARYRRKYGP